MTANEMIPAVGQLVRVRFEDLKITCRVLDVKTAWGRPRLQIEPVGGVGQQWIELARVVGIVQPFEGVEGTGTAAFRRKVAEGDWR